MSDAYDPTAPEGEISSRGHYITAKEARLLILLFVGVFLALIPVYQIFKRNTDKSRCTANMKAIYDAMALYYEEHDSRYPPIDRSERPDTLVPSLGDTGHVYTWASDVSQYMTARASFLCPSAKPDEIMQVEDPRSSKKTIPLTYGMYAPYGGYLSSLVENPNQTIILGETSNRGAEGSYDPMPFKSESGQDLPDGFMIGWSNSNDIGDAQTNAVTRLAFSGVADGHFTATGDARHGDIIHVVTASGELVNANQLYSLFHEGKLVDPKWTLPAIQR
jgi:hypothetical protein